MPIIYEKDDQLLGLGESGRKKLVNYSNLNLQ